MSKFVMNASNLVNVLFSSVPSVNAIYFSTIIIIILFLIPVANKR